MSPLVKPQPVVGGIAWWVDSNITPVSINESAVGTPTVGDPVPNITLTGITSGEAFGETVVGYDQQLTAASAESGEAFGEPIVLHGNAQGIRPFSIISGAAFGTPELVRSHRITAAGGIPTQETFGTPTIPTKPKFDAVGAAAGIYGGTPRATINGTAGAYGVVDFGSTAAVTITSATWGGVAMVQTASSDDPRMVRFELSSIPGGPKDVIVNFTGGAGAKSALIARSYTGVESAAAPTVVNDTGADISDPETCGAAEIIVNGIGLTGANLTSFTGGTQRAQVGGGNVMSASDAVANTTFTGDGGSLIAEWASINTILSSLAMSIYPDPITSGEAFGTTAVSWDQTITATGIASGAAFGTPRVGQVLSPTGIGSGEAFGTAALSIGEVDIAPTGIDSEEAFGNPVVSSGDLFVVPTGIASGEVFGTQTVGRGSVTVTPTGIPSGEAFGTATVGRGAVNISPSSITTGEAVGTHTVAVGSAKPTIVNTATNATDTITIPPHQVGDLILIFAYRGSNGTPANIPGAGVTVPTWINIDDGGGNVNALRVVYAVATATDHTSGAWGATANLTAVVIRGQHSTPIGGALETGGNDTLPTAPAVTLTNTDDSSLLLHFYGTRQLSGASWASAPVGYTRVTQHAVNNSISEALNSKNSTTSDGAIAQGTTGSTGWRAATVEIRSH